MPGDPAPRFAWPAALAAAYPPPPGRWEDRPWWNRYSTRAPDCFVVPGSVFPNRWRLPDGTASDWESAAVAWDEARPLPHPGHRAGQVWASPRPDGTFVAVTLGTHLGGRKPAPLFLVHDPHTARGYAYGQPYLVQTYPYLLADPACPWLAPWVDVLALFRME